MTTFSEWKASIEAFDKLVVKLPEGIAVQPLYVEAPPVHVPGFPDVPAGDTDGDALGVTSLHDLGADAVDELAVLLASGAAAFESGKRPTRITINIGRDTFAELCKLRALRIVWKKLATIAGRPDDRLIIHAVASRRTLTTRDPWVNMLRVTTQAFAAILGGADTFAPLSFDALAPSPTGQRVAANTELILRHESGLGRVSDPAAGSYYLDTLTDQLARAAWARFQEIEAQGGIDNALPSITASIKARWEERLAAIAKRRIPIVGVSDFANLDENVKAVDARFRHDSAQFETLRLKADALQPRAVLVALGTIAESRARVGFALNFLAAGGIRAREVSADEKEVVAVLCGTDERYATEAVARAKSLKAAGCTKVLLAGRPGANEAELRAAGVDGFIFIGCDLIDTLSKLLESYP